MNKYAGFTNIVKEHFSGELQHVDFIYSDNNKIHIDIEYKDDYYTYSYGVEMTDENHHVEFCTHTCLNYSNGAPLKRNVNYELGVEKLLSNY